MNKGNHTFIDLFAGIGGIRIGFEQAGGECVFSSEWDKWSRLTYKAFFGHAPTNKDIHDITKKNPEYINKHISDHDILTGGFPCQPFSIAGVSKKGSMGRPHGFDDPTQGTLFFEILKVIRAKKPKIVFLENVKNIRFHEGTETYKVILDSLAEPEKGLKYVVVDQIIDARHWVPQHRERIFFVAIREDLGIAKEELLECLNIGDITRQVTLSQILESEEKTRAYTLTLGTWNALQKHKQRHQLKGNGFGYAVIEKPFKNKTTRTLSARYYKDGGEILIRQSGTDIPRKLMPIECLRLQGFPKRYENFFNGRLEQPVSDHQAYRQFGNSVAVPVIGFLAKNIIALLDKLKS
jgi:DNA (cytosine-5)-methyltransferase 1